MRRSQGRKVSRARENRDLAVDQLSRHPLFARLGALRFVAESALGRSNWSQLTNHAITCDTRVADPEEWVWVLAHQLCHLGMGHLSPSRIVFRDGAVHPWWNAACCVEVDSLLHHLRLGRCPIDLPELPSGDADDLWRRWRTNPPTDQSPHAWGVAEHGDLAVSSPAAWLSEYHDWPTRFAAGLQDAVAAAVDVAGGVAPNLSATRPVKTAWRAARDWFISSYPLLGGLAAGFTLIEDAARCERLGIEVAAVDVEAGEILLNPHRSFTASERRFIVAHEILHAALRHDLRADDRDPFLWNVACDYVINGWLVEMEVGTPPDGLLHDPQLTGWSAEEVYTRIAKDLRRQRKLRTFRGLGRGDILTEQSGRRGLDLDGFYRRALANGLEYHRAAGRGLLPAGLVEEIRARTQPPIGWRVELARWFDQHFPPVERVRSYARLSRRQSSSPDIPRPALVRPADWDSGRTFGVVLDTSWSMDTVLLGQALGAIASYAAAREVSRVRVVFCDAAPHDAGWLAPEDISGRVQVKGRGGTVLQPGIDLLHKASDFPETGPILIITDGECDRLIVRREHAYLLPRGVRLPFTAKGPLFRLS